MAAASHDQSRNRARFMVACAATCGANATWWLQPLLMFDLSQQFNFGESGAGLIVSVEMAAMAVSSMLFARYAPAHRQMRIWVTSALLALFFSLLTLTTDSLPLLVAIRTIVGASMGASLMVANALPAALPDPDKAYGRLGVINIIVGSLLALLVPQLTDVASRYAPFAAIAICFALSLAFAVPALARVGRSEEAALPEPMAGLPDNKRLPVILTALATFGLGMASGTLWAFYALIGEDIGMSSDAVAGAISASIFTAIGGAGLAAFLGSRYGRILPSLSAIVIMAGAIIILSHSPSPLLFRIATCANVTSLYFLMPFLLGTASALDPSGRGSALVGSAFVMTGAFSPAVGGILAATTGLGAVGVAVTGVAIVAAVILVAANRRLPAGQDFARTSAI